MCKFYYEYAKNKLHPKLLFTNTDSLVYEIKGEDVYEVPYSDIHLFDFTNYPVNSKYYDPANGSVLGKIKDEFKGVPISAFIGLNSKMYSLISVDDEEVSKGKGVNKKVIHTEFVDVLFNRKVMRQYLNRIQSKLHRVGTYNVYNISLPCFDDKRYVLDDGIIILAYFHKDKKL